MHRLQLLCFDRLRKPSRLSGELMERDGSLESRDIQAIVCYRTDYLLPLNDIKTITSGDRRTGSSTSPKNS
jgi:hypothetical protein